MYFLIAGMLHQEWANCSPQGLFMHSTNVLTHLHYYKWFQAFSHEDHYLVYKYRLWTYWDYNEILWTFCNNAVC